MNIGATIGPIFSLVFALASLVMLGFFTFVKFVPIGIATMLVMSAIAVRIVGWNDRAYWKNVLSKLL